MLTPVQQAKLVLLLPRLEREFAQFIREVAGGKGKTARNARARESERVADAAAEEEGVVEAALDLAFPAAHLRQPEVDADARCSRSAARAACSGRRTGAGWSGRRGPGVSDCGDSGSRRSRSASTPTG